MPIPGSRYFWITVGALIGLVFPQVAYPWGSGHDDIMRAIIARLPPELLGTFTPSTIENAIRHGSHYPDSFEPFLANEIGEEALARLASAGIKVRYDLHSERGAAMCFIMLVDSIRESHPGHTAHWIAALSHVTADMAACNHDPLVHTANYCWGDWGLRLPNGAQFSALKSLLDLSGTARDATGGAEVFNESIESQMLHDDQRTPSQALIEVMLYGQEGAGYCSKRGVRVLEGAVGWVDRQDQAEREQLWKNIGELGAWSVVRTLRDVEVAMRFARADMQLEITPEIELGYRRGVEQILRDRSLSEEALFVPVLHELQQNQPPAIGIVLEPSWAMNGAMLGFSSRVQSVAIARTLQHTGQSYATFDVRQLIEFGFPSPVKVPLFVLVMPQLRSYHNLRIELLDQQIARYIQSGGRVLYVMGSSQPAAQSFAQFTERMQRQEKSTLPVSDEQFLGAHIEIVRSGDAEKKISHPVNTRTGWHKPICPWTFDLEGSLDLRPLVILKAGSVSHIVGAITDDAKIACVPIYVLTPYLFEGDDHIASAHEPKLDSVCEQTFKSLLRAMK